LLSLDPSDLGAAVWTILSWGTAFLAIFLFSYRNRILSIFDPLLVLVVGQVAYCVMGLALVSSPALLFQLLASQAALVFGFLMARRPEVRSGTIAWTSRNIQIAEWTVFLLFLLLLSANLWLGVVAGFPVFSNNPQAAKESVYEGGLGLIRRINMGVGTFVPAGTLLLALKGKHKTLFGICFAGCILISSLTGSKGALLGFLEIIGYVLCRRDLISRRGSRRLWAIAMALVMASIVLGVAVVYVVTKDWGVAIAGFLGRILLQGDVIIYYYDPRVLPHFASYNPLDFVTMLLSPILGELRLTPYALPLGYQMVLYFWEGALNPDYVIGPNTPFFVAGHIYFGSFFGVIYCGFVGYFVASVRGWFLEAQGISPLRLMWLLSLAVLVFSLPTEVTLFTGPLMDMAVMVFGTFVFAHFLSFILTPGPEALDFLDMKIVRRA